MSSNGFLVWLKHQDVPPLELGHVHVWSTSLVAPPDEIRRLRGWLSTDERERADRIRLEHLGDRFVVSRGRQREILAAYLAVPPGDVRFEYGEVGKPRLAEQPAGHPLHFNLSNSNEMALLAVSRDRELGVDVEHLDRRTDGDAIARRFFSERERQELAAAPADDRRPAFFRCWTRKEAVLKALGVGLTFPLDRIEVSLAADEPPQVLALDDRLASPGEWSLVDLKPADHYVAALALQGGPAEITCMAWMPLEQRG